jgi:effector-binding domain-containing protein
MTDPIDIVVATTRHTAVVARTTTWEEFPSLWVELLDEVYRFVRGGGASQDGQNVMVYLDDTPRVEVGVEVAGPFTSDGPVVSSTLPVGLAATMVHRGSYDGLGDTHLAVREWCAEHGHELSGVRWEVYGDWREDPDELETQIYYLLA